EIREWPHGDAACSFQYTACTALMNGSMSIEHFAEDVILSPEINELIGKSRIEALPAEITSGSRVVVRLKDGREVASWKGHAKGDEADPMTEDDILAKFFHQVEVSGAIDKDQAQRLVDVVLRLDELEDLTAMTALAV